MNRKSFRSLAFLSLLSLVVLTPLAFYLARTPGEAAAWFDDTYGYRHKGTFTHNASVTDNRAVTFTLDTAELITAGTMQSDCDDTRFTDINGHLLLFDLTGTCNNAATTYEVIIPQTFSDTNLFYVYYGNTSAPNAEIDSTNYTVLTPSGGDPSLTNPTSSGNQEKTTGPLVYWSFDEGKGTVVGDGSSNGRHGTASGVDVWKHQNPCVSGNCILLPGSTYYAYRAFNSSTDQPLNFGTSDFTVSVWAKRTSPITTNEFVAASSTNAAGTYGLYMNSSGQYCFGIDDDASWGPDDSACSSASFNDGQWHHVTGVRQGSAILIYIDGTYAATDSSLVATGAITNTSNVLSVGNRCVTQCSSFGFWWGFIDEFRLHNYARTANQVRTDYILLNNAGSAVTFGPNTLKKDIGTLHDNLVGYWFSRQDTNTSIVDRSGYSQTLTNVNSVAATPSSRYSWGGSFTRTSSRYLYRADNATLSVTGSLTTSAWINPSSNTAATQYNIMGKWDGANESYLLAQYGDEVRLYIDDAANYVETTAANLATSTWYHVVGVYDASAQSAKIYINGQEAAVTTNGTIPASIADDAGRFHIGAEDSTTSAANFFDGVMDEARLYNRALSTQEALDLYTIPLPPVVHYSFDEGSGTTARSQSGFEVDADLINSPTWTKGKFGSAISFNGNRSHVHSSVDAELSITNNLTISMWVYRITTGKNDYLITKFFTTTQNYYVFKIDTSDQLFLSWYNGSSTITATSSVPVTTPTGAWAHYTVVRDTDVNEVRFYENGKQLGAAYSFAGTNTTGYNATYSSIGCVTTCTSANSAFFGSLDEIKVYHYVRTQKQIVQDMNAGHPAVGSPVGSALAHYKFDEGADNTCTDGTNDVCNFGSAGSTVDGAQSNMAVPSTSSSGWQTGGKFGKAIAFDSDNDVVNMGSPAAVDDLPALTISAWIYPESAGEGSNGRIIQKAGTADVDTDGWLFYLSGGTELGFIAYYATNDMICNTSGSSITYGSWHYVAVTWDGTANCASVNLYVNGVLKSAGSDTGSGAYDSDAARNLLIGNDATGTRTFDGVIDEVKLYNYVLTTSEVGVDMNKGSAQVMGTTDTGQNLSDGAGNSPVAYWNFNENSGTNANDTSGTGITGVLGADGVGSDLPTWKNGKHGGALSFDGTDDFVQMPDNASLSTASKTLEAWVKTTGNGYVLAKATTAKWEYGVIIESNVIRVNTYQCAGADHATVTGTTVVNDGKWHHIAAVQSDNSYLRLFVDGKQDASTTTFTGSQCDSDDVFYVGRRYNGVYLSGTIDEVKVFDYARTPAQIAFDYNGGAPIAHWKFNECQGTTAYNSALTGNNDYNTAFNGTININGTGNTVAGTCNSGVSTHAWNNGTTGKFNSALDFDGSSDYMYTPEDDAFGGKSLSMALWIKPDSLAQEVHLVTREKSVAVKNFKTTLTTSGAIKFMTYSSCGSAVTELTTSSGLINTGQWHHVVFTLDHNVSKKIYINGKLQAESSQDAAIPTSCAVQQTVIGASQREPTVNFDGLIDDVRIYHYPLSTTQIKQVYNNDSAVSF